MAPEKPTAPSHPPYDTIIIGAGLAGLSMAYKLRKAGQRTLVIEQGEQFHEDGSSHGNSRMFRLGYDHPLVAKLTQDTQKDINILRQKYPGLHRIIASSPCVSIVPKDSDAYEIILKAALENNPKTKVVSAQQLRERGFKGVKDGYVGIYDDETVTGVINPRLLMETLYNDIKRPDSQSSKKSDVRFNEKVKEWKEEGGLVVVGTDQGNSYTAKNLVLAANAWMPEVLRMGKGKQQYIEPLAAELEVGRVPVFYFKWPTWKEQIPGQKEPKEHELMDHMFRRPDPETGKGKDYAMRESDPMTGESYLKVGFHTGMQKVKHPDHVTRTVSEEEIAEASAAVKDLIGQNPEFISAKVCLYGIARNTSEREGQTEIPIVGKVPGTDNVYTLSEFNGGGAKGMLAWAEVLARKMTGKEPLYNTAAFDPSRYGPKKSVDPAISEEGSKSNAGPKVAALVASRTAGGLRSRL